MNKRAIIIVLDSFGIGYLPDAKKFGDYGADTLGHIDEYANNNNISFEIPNLLALGLGQAYLDVNKKTLSVDKNNYKLNGYYGACKEISSGKDTTSGHWEMAGYPVLFDWGYFTDLTNSFPTELLNKIIEKAHLPILKQIQIPWTHACGRRQATSLTNSKRGDWQQTWSLKMKEYAYLGNCHASGTEIIKNLGMEHIATGAPIFYTSADSVFQIACHEEHFGLDKLYKLCEIVRELLEPYNIARVIARPFIGETPETFVRTGNRKDYSVLPSSKTLLDVCKEDNGEVIAIGKIGDIYAHQGTTVEIKATGLDDLCNKTVDAIKTYTRNKTIIMTNLVDFDMQYGHRRDILGYKQALEYFDSRLPDLITALGKDDILILTADHGCDPTWPGSDHTREHIPFLMYNNGMSKNIGICDTYADIGQTVAKHLELNELPYGVSVI